MKKIKKPGNLAKKARKTNRWNSIEYANRRTAEKKKQSIIGKKGSHQSFSFMPLLYNSYLFSSKKHPSYHKKKMAKRKKKN